MLKIKLNARVVGEDNIFNATCMPKFFGSGSCWLKRSLNGKRIKGGVRNVRESEVEVE